MPASPLNWPTTRDESFKFTNLKAVAGLAYKEGRTALGTIPETLPKGVTLTSIKQLKTAPETPLAQRAAASNDDGWNLSVAPNARIEHPLALSFFYGHEPSPRRKPGSRATGQASEEAALDTGFRRYDDEKGENVSFAPRLEISIGENASLFLIERHLSSAQPNLLVNLISSVRLAKGASLTHLRLNEMDVKDTHLATGLAQLGPNSHYQHFALTTGALLSRHELHATLEDKSDFVMDGVTLLSGQQHGDLTSFTTHRGNQGRSRQAVRSILSGAAHGVFQGRIAVAPNARNNDAAQISRALLLSSGAAMDAKPELEILNDEVACSHGATIGAIDEQALFYLQSRGIPADEARGLLVSGFVSESLASLPLCLAPEAEGAIAEWLEAHHG